MQFRESTKEVGKSQWRHIHNLNQFPKWEIKLNFHANFKLTKKRGYILKIHEVFKFFVFFKTSSHFEVTPEDVVMERGITKKFAHRSINLVHMSVYALVLVMTVDFEITEHVQLAQGVAQLFESKFHMLSDSRTNSWRNQTFHTNSMRLRNTKCSFLRFINFEFGHNFEARYHRKSTVPKRSYNILNENLNISWFIL